MEPGDARNSHTAHAQHTHRRHAHNNHTHTQTYVLHTYSAKRSQGVQLDEKDLGLDNYQTPSGGYIPSNPNRTKHTGSDGTRAQVSLSALSLFLSLSRSPPPPSLCVGHTDVYVTGDQLSLSLTHTLCAP
jgi:hypothetical protein